jgi:hypothetical protein
MLTAHLNTLKETVLFFKIGIKEFNSVPSGEHAADPMDGCRFFKGAQGHYGCEEIKIPGGCFPGGVLKTMGVADVASAAFFRFIRIFFYPAVPIVRVIRPEEKFKGKDFRHFPCFLETMGVFFWRKDVGILEISGHKKTVLELVHHE